MISRAELEKRVAECEHVVFIEEPSSMPECDPTKMSRDSPVPHDYEHVGEEYGSLGSGGSYDVLKCKECGRVAYSPMAD